MVPPELDISPADIRMPPSNLRSAEPVSIFSDTKSKMSFSLRERLLVSEARDSSLEFKSSD